MLTVPAYEPDTLHHYLHLALYEIYATLNSDDEDEPELELTDENCAVIKDILVEQAKEKGYASKQTYKFRTETDVKDWLTDERKHSPYIDLVAIQRALQFDWGVIRNLTDEERLEFYRRLRDDRMWDPPTEGQRTSDKMTQRQRRWMEGSVAERRTVTHGTTNQAAKPRVRETHCLGCKEPLHHGRTMPTPEGHVVHHARNRCRTCNSREWRKP